MIPHSLRWVAGLIMCAALSVPVTLVAQRIESETQARATAVALTGGDPDAGRAAIDRYGCGGCHEIGGVSGAQGRVGPALKELTKRAELAGRLSNDPTQLQRWIREPQTIQPGGGMPDLGVSPRDARDIAAYLYSRR